MKSRTLRLAGGFFVASSLWLSSLPVSGVDVYRNTTTRLDKYYSPGIARFGDEIILAGGVGQTLTNFTFEYFGLGLSGNETVTLRLYANNGAQVVGGAIPAFKPNTILYDSGAFSIGNTRSDGNTLSFALPNVNVPGDFTWTVQFGGLDSPTEIAGLDLYDPPTIGNGYDDYWEQNPVTLDWELRNGPAGTPVMNFGAFAEAVPEASPVHLGLLAGAIWLGWSMYRRKRAAA